MLAKFLFRQNFIERRAAGFNTVTSIRHAALLQNFLELTVFAKSSVNGDKRKIDIFREHELFIPNINIDDLCA